MPDSRESVEVQVVKVSDRTSLVRVVAPRARFQAEPDPSTGEAAVARPVLVVARENAKTRRFHRLTPSPPLKPDEVTVEFAVPAPALQHEPDLSIALGEEILIDLSRPGAPPRRRSTGGGGHKPHSSAAVPPPAAPQPGSKDELIDAQAERIGELELLVGELRAECNRQQTGERRSRRAVEEAERALLAARNESEARIHALTDRCAELEATITDLLQELRAVSGHATESPADAPPDQVRRESSS